MRTLALLVMMALAVAGCTEAPEGDPDPETTAGPTAGGAGNGSGDGQDADPGSTPTPTGRDGGATGTGDTGEDQEEPVYAGRVLLYVKDAPEDTFSEVHIVVTQTEVHVAGGDEDEQDQSTSTTTTNGTSTTSTNGTSTTSTNGTSTTSTSGTTVSGNSTVGTCDAGWVTVSDTRLDIDLLATQGDLAAFLGGVDLPPCKITQIRLHTASAYGLTHDGSNETIRMANDVLKVVHPFTVTSNATTHVVVDIDLDRSLRQQGPQGWRLSPVIGKAYDTVLTGAEPAAGEVVAAPPE